MSSDNEDIFAVSSVRKPRHTRTVASKTQEHDAEDIFAVSIEKKSTKAVASKPQDLDELLEMSRKIQVRKEKEAKTRLEERLKDEEQLVKQVFTSESKEHEKLLSQAIGEQEKAQAELLKTDGPPPEGYFTFEPMTRSLSGSGSDEQIISTPVLRERLCDGSFRASINLDENARQVSSGEMNYLFEHVWLGEDQEMSTAAFDTLVSLVTGENEIFFSSRAAIPVPRNRGKSLLFDEAWKVTPVIMESVMMSRFLKNEKLPQDNARRGLRVIELCSKLGLIASLPDSFILILTFGCFPRAELLEVEIRNCVSAIAVGMVNPAEVTDVATRLADVCQAAIKFNPDHLRATQSLPLEATIRDAYLHRAVRLGNLLSADDASQKIFVESLQILSGRGLLETTTEEDDHAELKHERCVRNLIENILCFLKDDSKLAHDSIRQCPLRPTHFHRWQALIRLVEFALNQIDDPVRPSTMRYVFKTLHAVQQNTDSSFLDSHGLMLDTLRFVKRQCEPYLPRSIDGLVQKNLNFSSSKRAKSHRDEDDEDDDN